jgi:hypothetical protein
MRPILLQLFPNIFYGQLVWSEIVIGHGNKWCPNISGRGFSFGRPNLWLRRTIGDATTPVTNRLRDHRHSFEKYSLTNVLFPGTYG